jgi:hypothetical protein
MTLDRSKRLVSNDMEIDDGFLDWIADLLSEDYEYNMKTKELKRDFRSTKPQYSDINGQYKNFAEFQKMKVLKLNIN